MLLFQMCINCNFFLLLCLFLCSYWFLLLFHTLCIELYVLRPLGLSRLYAIQKFWDCTLRKLWRQCHYVFYPNTGEFIMRKGCTRYEDQYCTKGHSNHPLNAVNQAVRPPVSKEPQWWRLILYENYYIPNHRVNRRGSHCETSCRQNKGTLLYSTTNKERQK